MRSSGSVSEPARSHVGRNTFPTAWSETSWPRFGQRTGDPVVPPAAVLPRHLHNQPLDLAINPRPTRVGAVLRAIELLRHQLSKPAEDGLGFCHLGYFRKTLSAKPFADLGKRGALSVREPKPRGRVSLENAVFSGKIFDLKPAVPD
ncbi:MAG: hypothetical protein ACRD7E_25320 [Bryobacteraceae bacterium]